MEDGIAVLVVAFRGACVTGATDVQRKKLADALAMAVERASDASPGPDLAVLDTTRLPDGTITELGKFVDWVPRGLGGRLWRWAAGSDHDMASVASWFGPAVIVDSVRAGVAGLVADRRAGRVVERSRDGRIARIVEWTERGLVQTVPDDDGAGHTTDLWFRTRLVERAVHSSGEPATMVMFPFPDALASDSPAIRLRAVVVVRDGAICEVNLSPRQTRRPLAQDWLVRLGALPRLEELTLLDTGADDAEVLAALARFPRLHSLQLDGTNVTDTLVDALAGGLAPQLEHLVLGQTRISEAARARLAATRLDLHVS